MQTSALWPASLKCSRVELPLPKRTAGCAPSDEKMRPRRDPPLPAARVLLLNEESVKRCAGR